MNNGGPEFTVARFEWEAAVAQAHIKYERAVASDDALMSKGIENSRQYHIGSKGDMVVNVPHVRFVIVPQAQNRMIEDISYIVIRLGTAPSSVLPEKHLEDLHERGVRILPDDEGGVPTNDFFFEAVKTTGEFQRYYYSEKGKLAYSDAEDIMFNASLDGNKLVRFYDIGRTVDSSIQQSIADSEWPGTEAFDQIFHDYDVIPQETTGPTSNVA